MFNKEQLSAKPINSSFVSEAFLAQHAFQHASEGLHLGWHTKSIFHPGS